MIKYSNNKTTGEPSCSGDPQQSSPQLGHQITGRDKLFLSETGLSNNRTEPEVQVWRVNGNCEGKESWGLVGVKTSALGSCHHTTAEDPWGQPLDLQRLHLGSFLHVLEWHNSSKSRNVRILYNVTLYHVIC